MMVTDGGIVSRIVVTVFEETDLTARLENSICAALAYVPSRVTVTRKVTVAPAPDASPGRFQVKTPPEFDVGAGTPEPRT